MPQKTDQKPDIALTKRSVKRLQAKRRADEGLPPKRKPGPPKGFRAGQTRKDPEYLRAKGAYKKNPDRDPEQKPEAPTDELVVLRDYSAIAHRYAQDIVNGRTVASRLTIAACQRHLNDLRKQRTEEFPYYFDVEAANKFCARIEQYPHIKGQWAKNKLLLELEPWQCFSIAVPFGWKRVDDDKRRFREMYMRVPRKNSKSTMAAGIGLNMAFDDDEFGAEVYSGATSEKQAWEVFGPAKLMLERSPKLARQYGVEICAKALIRGEDNSRFLPMIGNPGDGPSPNCAIIDEYHEHPTPDQYNSMATGMGAREQPMIVIITTAGEDLASPCYDKDDEAIKVLEGKLQNETLFALIYTIDEEDDWSDPRVLPKANPNFAVSVSKDYLEQRQREAVTNPAYQNRFKTKHLDIWCNAAVAAISDGDWKRGADETLKREDFKGARVWKALDLASKTDILADVDVFGKMVGGERHYYAFGKYYIPADTVENNKVNQQAYRKWIEQGFLISTEGAENDFDIIEESVKKDGEEFQIEELRYDPWRATHLVHHLSQGGANVIEMPQAAQQMAAAFDEFIAALKAGRFHHDGNPVLAWMASNVIAKRGPKGVTLPGKEKDEKKIDGIVAAVMAISGAMLASLDDATGFDDWMKNVVKA